MRFFKPSLLCLLVILPGVIYIYFRYGNINKNKGIFFSSSKYAPYAYQIVPGPASKYAENALAYFEIQEKPLYNNIVEVKIRPKSTQGKSYQWKTYILKKGYRLYLAVMPDAEGEFNDTSNLDYLNYDIPVLVNNNGFITK